MKTVNLKWFLAVFSLAFVIGCQQQPKETEPFINFSDIDSTVRPQDDFFQFANGTWLANTEIPASESGWGAFNILHEKSTQDLQSILKEMEATTDYSKGSMTQLIADFYKSGMDSLKIEELGTSVIQNDLDKIAAIDAPEDILPEIARELKEGRMPIAYGMFPSHIISFYVYQDARNSDKEIAQFDQGELGLPTNEYYLKTDSAHVATREKYLTYIKEIFTLLGNSEEQAEEKAKNVLQLETKLAKASKAPVELRDPIANYNKYTVSQLDSMMPKMSWPAFIEMLGFSADTVLVGQPEYYQTWAKLMYSEPIENWKDLLTFTLVSNNAGSLNYAFLKPKFDFYGTELYGQKEMKPRWKRLSQAVNGSLRDAMGKLYVERYFPPEAKERMDELVDNLVLSYEERIKAASWMTDSTKEKALEKLHAVTRKIGYPDKWDDYQGVEISPDTYLANLQSLRKYGYTKMLDKLGKPVDQSEWLMTPPTVNAYYNPTKNEIVFPAGILQPPCFNKDADDAINYGGIGVVIGHEITHGFDDKGRLFDANGNMNEWWTEMDAEKYGKQAQAIVEQFNKIEVMDSLFINGELTQGENIADLGGLAIAYNAFKKTEQGKSDELIDGLTPDQRFFLSYAKVWMNKTTQESLRNQVLTDPHPPAKYRVNEPLSNMPQFYAAFDVQPGDALYKPDSLHIVIW